MGRVEAFNRLHQADIAFLDQIGQRQAIPDITASNMRHEAQMSHDQPLSCFQIIAQPQPLGQFLLFFGAQHRRLVDRLEITVQTVHRRRQVR